MQSWEALDDIYATFATARHVPGLVAGVVIDGSLAHTLTHGVANAATGAPMTIDHRFRIASMSKSFTALAVLHLRDRGRLSLDTPVSELVPQLEGRQPLTPDSPELTVRHLLHHLAGDVTDDPWADRLLGITPADFSAYLAGGWTAARPLGTAFGYSNLGYALLGRVIQAVSGIPYQAYVHDLLFAPLGMTATTYDPLAIPEGLLAAPHRWTGDHLVPDTVEADGEFGAMGGIITTIGDFARYVSFVLDAWPARGGADDGPVKRSTLRELATGHGLPRLIELVPGTPATAGVYGYGMIAALDAELGPMFQHSGGLPGYGSNVMFFPELGAGVFSFANLTYAAPIAANRSAAGLLRNAGAINPRPIAISAALQQAATAALAVYDTGSLEPVQQLAAPNLFTDVPADEMLIGLAQLRARYGEPVSAVTEAEHLLAGKLRLTCTEGEVVIDLRLTPTPVPQLQVLAFHGGLSPR